MTKKLTITVSDEVFEGLHRRIGWRKISSFIDEIAQEHFLEKQLDADYAVAAADEQREREAKEWIESGVNDGLPDEDCSDWAAEQFDRCGNSLISARPNASGYIRYSVRARRSTMRARSRMMRFNSKSFGV